MLRKRRREAALQAERDAPPGMKRAGSTMPYMLNGTGGTVGSQGSLGSGPDGRRGKDYFGALACGTMDRARCPLTRLSSDPRGCKPSTSSFLHAQRVCVRDPQEWRPFSTDRMADVSRRLPATTSLSPAAPAGNMDVAIKGWDIDIAEIEFARRPDGSEWLLGEG